MRVVQITSKYPVLVYSSTSTITVYPLYSKALVISGEALAISEFIIVSYETLALIKPLLNILYYYIM